jgi:hypothetical protein
MVGRPSSLVSVDPELASAVERWGRGVFGAPRRLSTLITAVEPRDEVLHRVFTDVVQRELREERTFATERYPSSPRVPLARVDPFAGSLETLRGDTLHLGACTGCSSSGAVWCPTCSGRRVVSCSSCFGAGKFRNPRTNRMNQCKVCKGSGMAGCGGCGGSGKVMCQGCRGSGHQWIWLTYTEARRPRTMVHPTSPVTVAHPQLGAGKALTSEDVNAFWLEGELHAAGPLNPQDLSVESLPIVQHELAKVDRRLERVVFQQYMRLSVVRRDVSYQMCGTTGTVSLSGRTLMGASTPQALRPIKRRLVLWPIGFATVLLAGLTVAGSAMGKAAYFAPTNQVVSMLMFGATLLSVPWIGGLLRAWRPLLRLRGLRLLDLASGGIWALQLVAIAVLGVVTRPQAAAVEEALAAGDVDRARLVLDALIEREGESALVLEVEDAVLMDEAEAAEGNERLAKLDLVVSHQGARAEEAKGLARLERLAAIRSLVDSRQADEAIAAIDRDFGATWRQDPELAEERARAEEIRAERCTNDPCRLLAQRAAAQARETPSRVEAVENLRAGLLAALAIDRDLTALSPAERVRVSDEVASVAVQVLESELNDEALIKAATAAKAWAAEQRAAVAILGAELETVRALFPGLRTSSTQIASVSLEGAELFFDFDAKGKCQGVYAVGPKGHRELDGATWSAEQILAQAFGHTVAIHPTKDPSEVSSSWKEGKTKIVARWRGQEPIELRIGKATP